MDSNHEYELTFDIYGSEGTKFDYECHREFVNAVGHDYGPQKVHYIIDSVEEINNSGVSYESYFMKFRGRDCDEIMRWVGSSKSIPQFGWIVTCDLGSYERYGDYYDFAAF